MIANSFTRTEAKDIRGRTLLLLIAAGFLVLLERGSYEIFDKLLHRLPDRDLGPPLILRLFEMTHILFFSLLAVSSLTTMLSALFLDEETRFLLGCPLRLRSVWSARFFSGATRASWFVILADLPLLFAYGRIQGAPLWYFPAAALLLVLYLVPPVSLGAAGAMLVVRYVPARRAKETLSLIALFGVVAAVMGMRFMEPERFLNPRAILSGSAEFLAEISRPAAPYLPAADFAQALTILARGSTHHLYPHVAGLFFWAGGVFAAASILANRIYLLGIRQTLGTVLAPPPFLFRWFKDAMRRLHRPETAEVIIKDVTLFWRDPQQWSQLVVLGALVIIYVFNFRQIRGEFPSLVLRDVIAFLNVGMAGFVLVAVANRFVFSSISLEGRAFWLIRTSPVSLFRIVWAKGVVAFLPLLLLAEALTLLTYYAIGVSGTMVLVAGGAVALMTLAVTSLGLGLGMLSPHFDAKDPAEIGMSPAGLLFIAAGLVYVCSFLVILATPLYVRYFRLLLPVAVRPDDFWIPLAAAAVLHLVVVILPFRAGLVKLGRTVV